MAASSPWDLYLCLPTMWGYSHVLPCLAFHVGPGDHNSHLHAWATSTSSLSHLSRSPLNKSFSLHQFSYFVYAVYVPHRAHVWKPEAKLQKSVLSLNHMDPRDLTQVVRLGAKHLHPQWPREAKFEKLIFQYPWSWRYLYFSPGFLSRLGSQCGHNLPACLPCVCIWTVWNSKRKQLYDLGSLLKFHTHEPYVGTR